MLPIEEIHEKEIVEKIVTRKVTSASSKESKDSGKFKSFDLAKSDLKAVQRTQSSANRNQINTRVMAIKQVSLE